MYPRAMATRWTLEGRSADELERTYGGPLAAPALSGVFEGRFLRFLDTRGAHRLPTRVMDTLLFDWTRFGIDFDRRLWWFGWPGAGIGRFRDSPGPSRWRDTDVLRLEYDVSRLPSPVRKLLYDEIKPLDDDHALGLGGLDAPRGEGDHFWFELRRI